MRTASWPRTGSPPGRGTRRTARLVAVVLVLLSALGGGAAPDRRLVRLFSVPILLAARYPMTDDNLYVWDRQRVSAYRVPEGTRRW